MTPSKHNFPKGKAIICEIEHNAKQAKEIFRLCLENNVKIEESAIENLVDSQYPNFIFYTGSISQINLEKNDLLEKDFIISYPHFKLFLQGKGKESFLKKPYIDNSIQVGDYTADITKKEVVVGCTHISHETVKEIYESSQKALKS